MKAAVGLLALLILMSPIIIMAYWAGRMAYGGIDGYGWFLLVITLLMCGLKWKMD